MFKADLQRRCRQIFGVEKTTYLAPDREAPEQDTLFIEVTDVRSRLQSTSGGRETAIVQGVLVMFSQANRLPFGFFAKRMEQAALDERLGFVIYPEVDRADSPVRLQNLHERNVPFLFLYDSQYDPDRGQMTDLSTTITIQE